MDYEIRDNAPMEDTQEAECATSIDSLERLVRCARKKLVILGKPKSKYTRKAKWWDGTMD